ncbi:MAG TPA: hypothetical protein VH257_03880 [Chloroflexota bacterium]|nr:hypothetical protein [Chloroflexota bacterium]
MIIEHRPCPRCQIPNTARFSDGVAVCFNCQASWNPQDPEGTLVPPRSGPQAQGAQAREAPAPAKEPAPYPFSAPELARLAVYRDAVRAGFYNEDLEQPTLPEEQEAA